MLILLSGLSTLNPSLAQNSTLQDEIAAYNKGDFSQTISIGRDITNRNLNDATAHYYMANAYARLSQTKEAIEEYSFCEKITDNPQLKTYCDQALHLLIDNQPNGSSNYSYPNQVAKPNQQNTQADNQLRNRTMQDQIRDIEDWFHGAKRALNHKNPTYRTTLRNLEQIRDQRIDEVRSAANIPLTQPIQTYNQNPNGLNPNAQSPNTLYPGTSPSLPAQVTSISPANTLPTYVQTPTAPNLSPNTISYPPSSPSNVATPPSSSSIISQPNPYSNLFDHSPLSPPPFPASAVQGAEKALGKTIN